MPDLLATIAIIPVAAKPLSARPIRQEQRSGSLAHIKFWEAVKDADRHSSSDIHGNYGKGAALKGVG